MTYWDVLRNYHKDLYKLKVYWASCVFVILALIFFIKLVSMPEMMTAVYFLISGVVGVILLGIAKLSLLKKRVI